MKVLFLTNIPSPYRVDFFNMLGEICELTVTFEGHGATDRESSWLTKEAINYNSVFLRGCRTSKAQFFCPEIVKYLRLSYDRIIVGGYSSPTAMLAIEYMKFHKIPFWLETDGGFIKKDNFIKFRMKRHFISAASAWFASGENVTPYLVHYGAKKEKIYNYPFTSICNDDIVQKPLSKKEREILRSALDVSRPFIMSVGQFIPRKGFDVLIKAFSRMYMDYDLYIIGGIPDRDYLQLIESLHIKNIHFLEFKTKEELMKYYKSAEIFVFPTREDIWGLVINEAMANGLPVITTDRCVAGLELIENGVNGYLVSTDDVENLAKKMIDVLSNEELRTSMAYASLKKIKNYTIENMVKKHIQILGLEG